MTKPDIHEYVMLRLVSFVRLLAFYKTICGCVTGQCDAAGLASRCPAPELLSFLQPKTHLLLDVGIVGILIRLRASLRAPAEPCARETAHVSFTSTFNAFPFRFRWFIIGPQPHRILVFD
jgi:hypothetical protein